MEGACHGDARSTRRQEAVKQGRQQAAGIETSAYRGFARYREEARSGQLAGHRRRVTPPMRVTRLRCHDSSCAACARHRMAQASAQGVHGASRGRQTVWLHGSSATRGRIAVQYQRDRRRIGTGRCLVRASTGTARNACALQSSRSHECMLVCAAHRVHLAIVTRDVPPCRQCTRRFRPGFAQAYSRRCRTGCVNYGVHACAAPARQHANRSGDRRTVYSRLAAGWRKRIQRRVGESKFDAGKKVSERRRNLVVDTKGLLIAVTIIAASARDRDAATAVAAQTCANSPRLETLNTDGAYAGKCTHHIKEAHHIRIEVGRRPDKHDRNAA